MLKIFLAPISQSNINFIFNAESSDDCYLWTNRNKPISERLFYEDFKKRESDYYQTFFIAYSQSKNTPIGFIYSYGTNLIDGYCFSTIYITPEYRKIGAGALVGAKFLDYLFSHHCFRKIYFDVFDYNMASQKFLINSGCIEEGLLKKHKYYANGYHDLHRFALYRDVFYEKSEKILKHINKI